MSLNPSTSTYISAIKCFEPLRSRHGVFETVFEQNAVRKPGQLVVLGHVGQAIFCFPTLRDVVQKRAKRLFLPVLHRVDGQLDRELPAIAAVCLQLDPLTQDRTFASLPVMRHSD